MLIPWSTLWRWGLPAALIIAAWMCGYWMGKTAAIEEARAKTIALMAQAHAREVALSKETFRLRETRDAEVDRINSRLVDALQRLRNRPERRMPATATCSDAGAGATGAQLSAPDASAFIGLASDADRTAADLRECQAWVHAVTSR